MDDMKAYVDGELSPERVAELDQLVADSPAFREEAEFYRLLGSEIRATAQEHPVTGADETIRKVRGGARRRLSIRELSVVAGCTIVAVVALAAISSGRRDGASETALRSTPNFAKAPATGSAATPAYETPASDMSMDAKKQAPTNQWYRSPADGGFGGGQDKSDGIYGQSTPASPMPGRASGGGSSPDLEREASVQGRRLAEAGKAANERAPYRDIINEQRNTGSTTTSEAHDLMRPKLIRTGELTVKVADARKAQEDARRQIQDWNGYIETSSLNGTDQEMAATLQIKVPEDRFEDALAYLRKMGRVLSENANSQDVTAEVVDTGTRVEVLADEEQNLIDLLNKTRDFGRQMQIRAQIRNVRMELQSMKAQKKALAEQTTYSSIHAVLTQSAAGFGGSSWSEDSWSNASSGLGAVGRVVGSALIYGLVYIPVWLPLAIAAFILLRRR